MRHTKSYKLEYVSKEIWIILAMETNKNEDRLFYVHKNA